MPRWKTYLKAGPKTGTDGEPYVYKVAIVAPTCFYYQVPLFQTMAIHPRIDLTVYFCSEEASLGTDVVKKFKTEGSWGVEEHLLEGYNYKFLRNYSPWPSYLTSVIGLMNFGILGEIFKNKPDVVILMSWMNPTWWLAVLACVFTGTPILYLTDQNVQRDLLGPKWKRLVKRLVLGNVLFRLTTGFLCAGTANRLLYEFYGVPDHKLVPFAFSWGFESLLGIRDEIKSQRNQLREQLGIPVNSYTVLYCGRLSPEKSPLYAIQAYDMLKRPDKALVIVGDGELRESLENYVASNKIESVHFFGFQNRREIPKYYAISDVLVVPSNQETWGIVVNEAMCFGLPVIASDQVGAARDLVRHGYNGYTFPVGDVEQLASNIQLLMDLSPEERLALEERSQDIIEKWSKRNLIGSLDQYFDFIYAGK
jgi:glycosyltransferase involved in cell wall biosynthesis